MTQSLSVLTGCTAGATVRPNSAPVHTLLNSPFTGKFRGCSLRTCENQVRVHEEIRE